MSRVGGLVAVATFTVFWIACVGGDPDTSSAAQGAANGACYPNQTCNSGLTCTGGVCKDPNATSSGGPSSSSGSSGGSSSGGPPGPTTQCIHKNDFNISCPGGPSTCADHCCYHPTGTSTCGSADAPCDGSPIACDDPAQCRTGFCCVKGNVVPGTGSLGCTSVFEVTQSVCVATANACAGSPMACAGSDCPTGNGTCKTMEVHLPGGDKQAWGICLNPF